MPTWTLAEAMAGITTNRSVTADGAGEWAGALTSGQTDVEVDADFVYSRLKGFIVQCPGAIKIETNANDASGGETLNVPAGGFSWLSGGVDANPFGVTVTRFFITDMSSGLNMGADAVKIKWLYDRTP